MASDWPRTFLQPGCFCLAYIHTYIGSCKIVHSGKPLTMEIAILIAWLAIYYMKPEGSFFKILILAANTEIIPYCSSALDVCIRTSQQTSVCIKYGFFATSNLLFH